jgi:hypothetical protein
MKGPRDTLQQATILMHTDTDLEYGMRSYRFKARNLTLDLLFESLPLKLLDFVIMQPPSLPEL